MSVLSALHDYSMVPVQVKSKRGKEMREPKAVGNYNSNMGGFFKVLKTLKNGIHSFPTWPSAK